jgi:regulatory protein
MSAYIAGLKMLARRELTERQIRERLARRGHEPDEIDTAVARLKSDRALDDGRVALAMARSEITLKRHGRLRAQRQLEAAGLPAALARSALDDVLSTIDHDALIEASLARRLRGRDRIADDREFQRLFRYLVGQGFEAGAVLALLRSKRREPDAT